MALFRMVTPQYIYRNLLKNVANTIEKHDHQNQEINIELYLVRMRENTDQKKIHIGTLFT